MKSGKTIQPDRLEDLDDASLVDHVYRRDGAALWLIMKRHNQRLHRIARAVLDDDAEAEDVLQETYIRAFTHLSEFRAEARLSTWLTRIALNEALGRRRQRRSTVDVRTIETIPAPFSIYEPDPERAAALADCVHHGDPATDSMNIRPPIPRRSGHRFHGHPATLC